MIYLTSDLHLGHLNALTIMPNRPWPDVEAMSHGLIDNFNSVVTNKDTVIILGDLIMGKKFENVPKYLPMLNGTKYLICGNHDFLPSEQKPDKLAQLEDLYLHHGIDQIIYGCVGLDMFTNDSDHFKIKLCHFNPSSVEDNREIEYEQRYTHLRPILNEDQYLLCGHCHSREHLLAKNVYHVGVDAIKHEYKPVSLNSILLDLGI